MSLVNILFLAVGAVALLIGGIMLVRPTLARRALRLREGEAATYALRIGGAMAGAFGLAMIVLTLTVVATTPSGYRAEPA